MRHLAAIPWRAIGQGLSASLAPLIAAIVAWIAYQQYVINRRQFRFALFEKRMAVYNTTMTFIAEVMQHLNPSIGQCVDFMRSTRDHEFLFDSEVGEFINKIYSQAVNLQTCNAIGQHTEAEEITNWFSGQMGTARQIFLKYLDFRKPDSR